VQNSDPGIGSSSTRVPGPHHPGPAPAGLTDHEPPDLCLEGCVGADAITMTERLYECVLHRIGAELLVTNDRAGNPLESRSIAAVEDSQLVERNRRSVVSNRAHAHAILKLPPCLIDESKSRVSEFSQTRSSHAADAGSAGVGP
jgi:hypothetical protein